MKKWQQWEQLGLGSKKGQQKIFKIKENCELLIKIIFLPRVFAACLVLPVSKVQPHEVQFEVSEWRDVQIIWVFYHLHVPLQSQCGSGDFLCTWIVVQYNPPSQIKKQWCVEAKRFRRWAVWLWWAQSSAGSASLRWFQWKGPTLSLCL